MEETFALKQPSSRGSTQAGEACYVAATINNRRYYGALVDQDALKSASLLHFQDAAYGLELNQRMRIMKQRQQNKDTSRIQEPEKTGPTPMIAQSSGPPSRGSEKTSPAMQQVQKFQFMEGSNGTSSEYRILLATYLNAEAAAEDDEERMKLIEAACQSGGDFVGKYYYQYEVSSNPALL